MVAAAAVLTAQMDITQEEMFWVNRIMMWQFRVSCNQIGLCQGQKGPAIRVPAKLNNVFQQHCEYAGTLRKTKQIIS